MAHTEFGPKLLEKILLKIGDLASKEKDARFEGRRFVTIIKPTKGKGQSKENINETEDQKGSNQALQDHPEGQNTKASADGVSPQNGKK